MKTVDLLRCAASELRDRGLTKGDFADYSGDGTSATCPVCTVGAINVAAGSRPEEWFTPDVGAAILAVAAHLGLKYEPECEGGCTSEECENCGYGSAMVAIGHWNDRPETTDADAIAALEATAEQLAVAS